MGVDRLTILVTGASGFLGRHLVTRLSEHDPGKIVSVSRTGGEHTEACDLSLADEAKNLLARVKPSEVFHCAGSFTNEYEADFRNNVLTTQKLLEAINELGISCRVLLVGSAAEYGIPISESGYISEEHPLDPTSIYGLTKVHQSSLMTHYLKYPLMDIVMGRIFNLHGNGISEKLFPGHIAAEVRRYHAGSTHSIRVGDLSTFRDYLPVDNAVDALITIMLRGTRGEIYNVGSGLPILMRDFLANLLQPHKLNLDIVSSDAESAASNTAAVPLVVADTAKLRALTRDS